MVYDMKDVVEINKDFIIYSDNKIDLNQCYKNWFKMYYPKSWKWKYFISKLSKQGKCVGKRKSDEEKPYYEFHFPYIVRFETNNTLGTKEENYIIFMDFERKLREFGWYTMDMS
jgi:hypothetical protein